MTKHNSRNRKTTPLVVDNEEWADAIPEWLRREVQAERLISGFGSLLSKGNKDGFESVGDAEVTAYLMPASFQRALDHDMAQIYLYCAGRVIKKTSRVKDLPKGIEVAELTDYQQQKLRELKRGIYESRGGKVRHPLLDMMSHFAREAESEGEN